MSRGSLLKPAELNAELAEILQLVRSIGREYPWVHAAAFAPSVQDPSEVTARGGPRASRPPEDSGTDPAHSDSTGNVVASSAKVRARRHAGRAVREVQRAVKNLRVGVDELADALGAVDRETYNPGPWPRTATRAEIATARDARERRRERGEDHGEA